MIRSSSTEIRPKRVVSISICTPFPNCAGDRFTFDKNSDSNPQPIPGHDLRRDLRITNIHVRDVSPVSADALAMQAPAEFAFLVTRASGPVPAHLARARHP
jgi:hypothetical protein